MDKVIAIDGPSGVGKSSVSKDLAARLGWTYLDTGAMYRSVTLAWMRSGKDGDGFGDPQWLAGLDLDFDGSKVLLDGEDISSDIRKPKVTQNVSKIAADPTVREHLTTLQRQMASRRPCILDGRDIGTVVFPQAFFKAFLKASPRVRAERRWLQLGGEDSGVSLDTILEEQEARDKLDSSRETAPLRQASDALVVQTDRFDQDQVGELLYKEAQKRLADLTVNSVED